jgi:hypothetical protein
LPGRAVGQPERARVDHADEQRGEFAVAAVADEITVHEGHDLAQPDALRQVRAQARPDGGHEQAGAPALSRDIADGDGEHAANVEDVIEVPADAARLPANPGNVETREVRVRQMARHGWRGKLGVVPGDSAVRAVVKESGVSAQPGPRFRTRRVFTRG